MADALLAVRARISRYRKPINYRTMSVEDMVNEGVRRAYTSPDNPLRASMLADPAGSRKTTRDNTPAMVYMDVVPGDRIEVRIAH